MFKNHLKTVLLLGTLSALIVGVGALVAPSMLALFAVLAVAMNIVTYFFSDKLVLRMHGASEVAPHEAPRLHAMVERLAAQAGIPKPRLFVIPLRPACSSSTPLGRLNGCPGGSRLTRTPRSACNV